MEGVSAHFLVSQESCISASIQKRRKKKREVVSLPQCGNCYIILLTDTTQTVYLWMDTGGGGGGESLWPVPLISERGDKNFAINLDSAIDQPKWFSVGFSLQSPPLVDTNIVQKKRKNKNKYCVHPSQGDVFRQNSPPPHSHLTSLHGIRTNLFDLLPFHETH